MTNVVLLGATGLVGNWILKELIDASSVSKVTTFTRRSPKQSLDKLNSVVSSSTETWFSNPESFASNQIAISAFGTTRANAGGLENFKKIDYGNNLTFAQTAKTNGIKTFILISTKGANSASMVPYLKIKGQLEDEILKLGFDHTIILQPGLLVGEREESRLVETIATKLGVIPGYKYIMPSNQASQVAKKAVEMMATTEKVKVLSSLEINQ